MEKLYVNRETFEALTQAIERNGEDGMMELHTEAPKGWQGDWNALNNLSIPEMAKALYVGYEVKPTPEEVIKNYYEIAIDLAGGGDYEMKLEMNAKAEAVKFTLDTLNVKIKGIND